MSASSSLALGGIVAASITPVTEAGGIDADRLCRHVRRLLDAGCDAVSPFGTTGEGPSFSVAERITALDALVISGIDPARLIPGVMANALADAVALTAHWAARGCRAALVMPPCYYTTTEAGVVDWFRALADAVPAIPFVLYNFPRFSGVTFTPALVSAVRAACPDRIAGLKDSTGDLDCGLALVAAHPDLAIFTGDDRVVPALTAAGGAGMIGGMPNAFPEDCVALVRGRGNLALAAHRIAVVDGTGGGTPALKWLVAEATGDKGYSRMALPLHALAPSIRDELRERLDQSDTVPV